MAEINKNQKILNNFTNRLSCFMWEKNISVVKVKEDNHSSTSWIDTK